MPGVAASKEELICIMTCIKHIFITNYGWYINDSFIYYISATPGSKLTFDPLSLHVSRQQIMYPYDRCPSQT